MSENRDAALAAYFEKLARKRGKPERKEQLLRYAAQCRARANLGQNDLETMLQERLKPLLDQIKAA